MSTAKYKIEKRIPIPKPAIEGAHYNAVYPFSLMAVGDSFEFTRDPDRHVQYAAYIYGRRTGKKFIARGNRIWRTT